MSALKWTKQKPTLPGHYWVKGQPHGYPARILEFQHPTLRTQKREHPVEPTTGPLSTEGWEWFAGPIPEPLEA